MDYFPLFLDIKQQKVLIVGGGVVAWRKAKLVARAGGKIFLVAPKITPELKRLIAKSGGTLAQRKFTAKDLDDSCLAIVAINKTKLEREIAALAKARNIPVNVVDNRELCSFITPAIVEREPLLVAISSAGKAPVVSRRLREDLEARLSDNYGQLAELMSKLRAEVQRKLPEQKRRRFYEDLWDSQASILLEQGKEKQARALARKLLAGERPPGMVFLVGAGPGASGDLTLAGLRYLHHADVILHDKLVGDEVLALARRDAEVVDVGKPSHTQSQVNKLMVKFAKAGKQVVRLKGGDPAIFARLHEEIDYLKQHKVEYLVSPGVTAALTAASAAGISLTDRSLARGLVLLSLQVRGQPQTKAKTKAKPKQLHSSITAILRDNAKADRTLVIYMGVENTPLAVAELTDAGLDPRTPAKVFEKLGHPDQRIFAATLADLPRTLKQRKIASPACIVIGKVAKRK